MPFAISTDGARIHYEVLGPRRGETVLLVQGLGADINGWAMQRGAFAMAGYRTVAFDNRGAGRSDKPQGPYDLQQLALDALAVLDAVGSETAHVVGASMGGAISQIIAVTNPQRVRSLTLACTACRNQPWRRELVESWAHIAQTQGMGALSKTAARWVIGPRSLRRISPLIGWLGPLAFLRPVHGFVAQVGAILAVDDSMSDALATITAPTLVVVGNQDILTPRGDSEEIAERIPGAELVVISGAAHGLMVEHWSTFNRVVLDFLRRVPNASTAHAGATASGTASAQRRVG